MDIFFYSTSVTFSTTLDYEVQQQKTRGDSIYRSRQRTQIYLPAHSQFQLFFPLTRYSFFVFYSTLLGSSNKRFRTLSFPKLQFLVLGIFQFVLQIFSIFIGNILSFPVLKHFPKKNIFQKTFCFGILSILEWEI